MECVVFLGFLLCGAPIMAQSVQQSGNVTPGHVARWCANGVLCDGGTPSAGSLTGLGVTTSGPGICQNSGPTSGAYNRVCLSSTSTKPGVTIDNVGGATGNFTITTNGVDATLATITAPTTNGSAACFNAAGALTDCAGTPITSIIAGTGIGVSGTTAVTVSLTTPVAVTNGGTGATSYVASLPLIGAGSAALSQGTRSGNTTSFATTTGSMTSGDCVSIDGSGNLIAAGGPCTVGGGGGTVTSSTAGEIPYYATTSSVVVGNPNLTISSGALTIGVAGSAAGTLKLSGSASGVVTLAVPSTAGSGTLTLPTGTDTLVGKATTDTFTNKTYDTAGTGNAFAIAGNSITGVSGTGNTVALTVSPTFTTPTIGAASGTSLALSSTAPLTFSGTDATIAVNSGSGNDDMIFKMRQSGSFYFRNDSDENIVRFAGSAASGNVNYFVMAAHTTGNAPYIQSFSTSDSNVGFSTILKGTGTYSISTANPSCCTVLASVTTTQVTASATTAATTTTNGALRSNGGLSVAGAAVLGGGITAGSNGGTGGSVKLFGATSGDATVTVAAAAGTATNFRLPASNGSSGQLLQTDGSGNTTWVTASGTGSVTSVAQGTGMSFSVTPCTATCTVNADMATDSNIWSAAADKVVGADKLASAGALVTLPDDATIATDMATGINFMVTLGGNRTLGAPTNTQVGRSGCIFIVQDGTGSRTLAYNAVWKFASGVAPTLTTTANAVDMLCYVVRNSTNIVASATLNIQ